MNVGIHPGDMRTLARAIRLLDDDPVRGRETLREVYSKTGRAWIIGVTGPAGVGKSTLVNQVIRVFRSEGHTVGVIAVDPTSPFSGGAILGDRIRMQDHENDPGVFIRSMATRGQMGGLSRSAFDVIDLMDAYRMDIIIVETVGVGQDEVDIARVAHTTVLVLVPGLGDEIQAMKAGLMEIADILVINKKDHPGASRMKQELESILALSETLDGHRPPIVMMQAVRAEGLDEFITAVKQHYDSLGSGEGLARHRWTYAQLRFYEAVRSILMQDLDRNLESEAVHAAVKSIATSQRDPYTAAAEYLKLQAEKIGLAL